MSALAREPLAPSGITAASRKAASQPRSRSIRLISPLVTALAHQSPAESTAVLILG